MTAQPPPAASPRLPWIRLPPRIPAALEAWAGAPIAAVTPVVGGFSPGVAARLTFGNGRRVFVKGLSPEQNPDAPDAFRREAAIARRLPASVPSPRLLWEYDEGPDGWVMLVFEEVDGWMPSAPWKPDELDRVVTAMIQLFATLTPPPIEAPSASDQFADGIRGWIWLYDDPPSDLDPWARERLDLLAELESRAPDAARGHTLLHFDLRADNILLTRDRAYVVDWPHAAIGAAWIDLVGFLPSMAMQGGPPVEDVFQRHPAAREADPADVNAVIASITGYFLHRASLQPPPGLPTLRDFQRAQGIEGLRWLRERLGE